MKPKRMGATLRSLLVVLCSISVVPSDALVYSQTSGQAQPSPSPSPSGEQATKIPPDQLDSLVAPIALYPDPLLAQTLAASTYPLEIIQLQQWLEKNSKLKDKELADAVAKQSWDPSIQAMAALPDVVKRLADDIQWTTDLGNAFLAQQSDVMEAVQRMRKKAQDKGNLKSTEQQKVETKVVENKSVIVVEQANPQVVYVPSYDPDGGVRRAGLSLPAHLLSAPWILRSRDGDFVRRWRGDGGDLGRRLGLGLRLGRQQRPDQQHQQFQPQREHQPQRQREPHRKLEPQPAASRWRAL